MHDMAVHCRAQVGYDLLTDPCHQVRAQRGEAREAQRGQIEQSQSGLQSTRGSCIKTGIDEFPDRDRHGEQACGSQHAQKDDSGERPSVWSGMVHQRTDKSSQMPWTQSLDLALLL